MVDSFDGSLSLFVENMPEEDFQRTLRPLARTEAFSVLASGMVDETAQAELRTACVKVALPQWTFETDARLAELVMWTARRIVK